MKSNASLFSILVLFILWLSPSKTVAQDLPGKRDSIKSTFLSEQRYMQVILPVEYKPGSTDRYDVLYVLDGDWNTRIVNDIQRFAASEGAVPPAIIISIFNTDRNRDLLPTHNDGIKSSGGANQFLRFFKEELIPYVNKTYPSNGDNTLFGHSFGGVFVTYALLTEPKLFQSYIAADPSYWWDNNALIRMVGEKINKAGISNETFYITGREGNGLADMRIPQIDSVMKKASPANVTWKLSTYPDETHGTVRLKSIYDGLRFSYAGYNTRKLTFHPTNGIMLKDQPIHFLYFDDLTKVKYTMDGTEPSLTSTEMKSENTIAFPVKIKAKRFINRDRYSQTFSGEFTEGTWLPPNRLQRGFKSGGFNYAYYEGEWDKLPDFKSLKPVKTGRVDTTFSIHKLPRQNNFALTISGQLEVKEEGYYVFAMDSDDGARFYLNDKLLIDLDGLHGDGNATSYIIPLKKGFYSVREEYFQKEGGRALEIEYASPSNLAKKKSMPIPLSLQYGINK